MEHSFSISETHKFRPGTKVFCSDGEEGPLTLASIVFDASQRCVFAIGIRTGWLFSKTVYIPFSDVIAATSQEVTLSITCEQLAVASKEVPAGIVLDAHTTVVNAEASAHGTLVLVAVQPTSGELVYLVAHHLREGQDTLLHADVISQIENNRVTVTVPEATLQTLPPYRTDEELLEDVEKVLFDLVPLHIDFGGIGIRVHDGILYIYGNISSSLRGDLVEDQAVGVQGLLGVQNRLVGDDTLASDLALALGRDPRTHEQSIGVYPRLGVVRLSGTIQNEEQKATAEEIAKSFPGVRAVNNDLVIRTNNDLLHIMASSAGGDSKDLVPGAYVRHTR